MRRRQFVLGATSALLSLPRAAAAKRDIAAENQKTLAGLFTLDEPLLDWDWVVIHHTAAEYASKKGIDRYHKKRFEDPLGTQYHFLIHNGKKGGPRGLIELARWPHQARSIHLFKPEGAPRAITICLVGNFEKRKVPRSMLNAAADLTATLTKRFSIPLDHITTHRGVDGRLTQCPGKYFKVKRFRKLVAARATSSPPPGPGAR